MNQPTLYGYWRSSSTWRVRIALACKGIAYENHPVHLVRGGGEQHSDAYRTVNPMQEVPVLEWAAGGHTRRLSQSLAIIEFLESTIASPPLLPSDPFLRARARQLAEMINAGIQPMQNAVVLKRVKEILRGDEVEWARFFIARGLQALEQAVIDTAGVHMVGDAVSVADICLIPQLYNARRYGVDLRAYPVLCRIEGACVVLPAFADAHPDRQPDAPTTA